MHLECFQESLHVCGMKYFFFFISLLWLSGCCFCYRNQDFPHNAISFADLTPGQYLLVGKTSLRAIPGPYCSAELVREGYFENVTWFSVKINTGEEFSWEKVDREHRFLAFSLKTEDKYVLVQNYTQMLNLMDVYGWKLKETIAESDSSGTRLSYLLQKATP